VRTILWALIGFEVFAFLAFEHMRSHEAIVPPGLTRPFDFPLLHKLGVIIVAGIPAHNALSWIVTLVGLMALLQFSRIAYRSIHRPE
jgi:hypothetical protein